MKITLSVEVEPLTTGQLELINENLNGDPTAPYALDALQAILKDAVSDAGVSEDDIGEPACERTDVTCRVQIGEDEFDPAPWLGQPTDQSGEPTGD